METTQHNWFYNQLFTNWKRFEVTYVTILLLLQVVVYAIAPDTIIGMISGVAGVLCLVYGMKGRKISFMFGFVQCIAMTYIATGSAMRTDPLPWIHRLVISQPVGWYMGTSERLIPSSRTRKKVFWRRSFIAFAGWFRSGTGRRSASAVFLIRLILSSVYRPDSLCSEI